MKLRVYGILLMAALMVAGIFVMRHSTSAAAAPSINVRSALPSEQTAKTILETTMRHREWVTVPTASGAVRAFVVYPERSDRAPVVFVSAEKQSAGTWIRAVSDQVAAEGYIAVVPDLLTGKGPEGGDSDSFVSPAAVAAALGSMTPAEIAKRTSAVRQYALALPAASGSGANLTLDSGRGRMEIATDTPAARATFKLDNQAWPQAIEYLSKQTGNNVPEADPDDHSAHIAAMIAMTMQQQGRGQAAPGGQRGGGGGGPFGKAQNLPAPYYVAQTTIANSKLRKEWVDIPMGDVKLHTWIEYPEGNGPAGIVIVMQHGTGLDFWMRGVADQLAQDGFIAVAPDMWSGLGPNGGGWDSFEFVDDAVRAGGRINADETIRRYKAARDFALKLPRSNGKTASLGFCAGGGNAFRFAGDVPELNAAVPFYGTPPDDASMAKIKAPVLAFYGENDARVTSTVEPTKAAMMRLGKSYEPHIYPKATHSFVMFQDIGGNPAAIADAWPRAIAFLKEHLR